MDAAHTATATNIDIDPGVIDEALIPAYVHRTLEGLPTEHISMGGEEEEQATITEIKPGKICKRLQLVNRVRGLCTDLTLFEEGFLKVRETHKKKVTKDYLLNLRYVSSRPTLTRHIATQTLCVSLGLIGAAVASWLIGELTSLARFLMPGTIVFATAALIAFLLFVYRTQEKIRFSTAHGDAEVLSLLATLGCYRTARRLVPELSKAADEAAADRLDNPTQLLRAEMQEHYRLREAEVLTPEACANGTRRILANFE